MTIDAATMNRRVVIERRTLTSTSWGPEHVWTDLCTVWAGLKYDAADEQFAAGQAYARRVVTFTLRYTEKLTAVDRLRSNGVTYDILGIKEIGFRDGLEVKAEATDPGGV